MNDRKLFESGVRKFLVWLDHNGTAGYDPYDLWSTAIGTRIRRIYYEYGKLAAPLTAPIVAVDTAFPLIARLATAKKRFATSHAHLILGFLDLHEKQVGGEEWLG